MPCALIWSHLSVQKEKLERDEKNISETGSASDTSSTVTRKRIVRCNRTRKPDINGAIVISCRYGREMRALFKAAFYQKNTRAKLFFASLLHTLNSSGHLDVWRKRSHVEPPLEEPTVKIKILAKCIRVTLQIYSLERHSSHSPESTALKINSPWWHSGLVFAIASGERNAENVAGAITTDYTLRDTIYPRSACAHIGTLCAHVWQCLRELAHARATRGTICTHR